MSTSSRSVVGGKVVVACYGEKSVMWKPFGAGVGREMSRGNKMMVENAWNRVLMTIKKNFKILPREYEEDA